MMVETNKITDENFEEVYEEYTDCTKKLYKKFSGSKEHADFCAEVTKNTRFQEIDYLSEADSESNFFLFEIFLNDSFKEYSPIRNKCNQALDEQFGMKYYTNEDGSRGRLAYTDLTRDQLKELRDTQFEEGPQLTVDILNSCEDVNLLGVNAPEESA
ncbi:MAG: hypothetical protein RLN62_04055 [Rickettsiales bacterium]